MHRSKGTTRVHIASCLDFNEFINLFSREGGEPAEEESPVSSFSPPFELSQPTERETEGTSKPVAPLFLEAMYQQMCHSRGDPVCDHLGSRGWKDTLWTFFFAQLPICIKLIRN